MFKLLEMKFYSELCIGKILDLPENLEDFHNMLCYSIDINELFNSFL